MTDQNLIDAVKQIARKAGEAILAIYGLEDRGIQSKVDETPVTIADLKANDIIVNGLQALEPLYPILSEESKHDTLKVRTEWHRYWLVDPLDGTQEFINRNGQFAVNIALMEKSDDGHSYPVFGVVHIPVGNICYWGGLGLGAFRQTNDESAVAIKPRQFQREQEVVALGSRSYKTERAVLFAQQLQAVFPNLEVRAVGSALKTCLVAEGTADFYPRLGPTSEWDTGAPQGVVEGAGGLLLDPEGQRFSYNFKESLLNSDFLVVGDINTPWKSFWNQKTLS
ncbi:3'(2'),5'-bisphosphate nucleotidase [Endozoicomonas sp. OPT23]|uniref:3'(2'),5'-bisphosphate nucleotidase CysQ n=1 Tax=Endozoicomonas sp. OPT23 TaxID=2072845 RepID=UPI00129AB46F|nr:3'(2'),5'-bisphosphate nucleotidase CysQ [Endozoicomonas sp. OPT23]MRI35112.1 3'(2'),5'-bisphosphate nucleotidase [Endozoicomonas sp. OPT23]